MTVVQYETIYNPLHIDFVHLIVIENSQIMLLSTSIITTTTKINYRNEFNIATQVRV